MTSKSIKMGSLTAPRNPYKQSWVLVINIIGHKMIRTHLQTRFRLQNKPFCIVIGMKYSKSIATKLLYQCKPIDTAIYEKFVVNSPHSAKFILRGQQANDRSDHLLSPPQDG